MIPAICFCLFLFSCKPDKNPVLPPTINPKQFTSQMNRDFTWKVTGRDYCLSCNPIYDSNIIAEVSFHMKVVDDSTVYRGTIDFNKITKYDLFHFVRHDEKEKYNYFECLNATYFSQSLKHYYNENRIELTSKMDSAGVRGTDILFISQ